MTNWGWAWEQARDCPMPVLILLYRQTAKSYGGNVGFDLSDLEAMGRTGG